MYAGVWTVGTKSHKGERERESIDSENIMRVEAPQSNICTCIKIDIGKLNFNILSLAIPSRGTGISAGGHVLSILGTALQSLRVKRAYEV